MTRRSLMIALSILVGALSLGALLMLSLLMLDGTYRDALLARYYLPARHLQLKLEDAIRAGTMPDAYSVAIEVEAANTRRILVAEAMTRDMDALGFAVVGDDAVSLFVVSPRGQQLYPATTKHARGVPSEWFNDDLLTLNAPGEPSLGSNYVKVGEDYVIPIKILDTNQRWVASVVVLVDADLIDARASGPLDEVLTSVAALIAVSMLIYTLMLLSIVNRREAEFSRKRFLWHGVIVGAVTQFAVAALIGAAYMDHYSRVCVERSALLATLVSTDIESALREGVALEELDHRHYPWERLVRELKPSVSLEVRDATDKFVFRVDARGIVKPSMGKSQSAGVTAIASVDDYVIVADVSRHGEISARVVTHLSRQALDAYLIDLGLDSMAAIMVSLIVLLEMLLLLCLLIDRRTNCVGSAHADACGRMRPAIFLFLFGIDLSMSFVPLHMELLYEPVFGLSADAVMALPISAEFLFVGVAFLAGGVWFDRCHWRPPFLVGVILAGAGALYSWLAPDALHFIASRAVIGAGYGFTLMAGQGFVTAHSDARNQTRAFARLFASLYGGSICGSVAGAILAERLGFGPVFLIGGVIVFLVLPYMAVVLPRKSTVSAAVKVPEIERRVGPSPIVGFLGNRSVLSLMLFSSLPASIAAVGFLHYFSPIYLNRFGASQSTIGQVLMLYGLCLIFLGPWVSRNIDTVARKRLAVIAGAILGGAAFLSFNVLHGLLAAIVAVVVLGISHSLVFSSQIAHALTLKATRELGEGKAIGLFRCTGCVGQVLGPMAFGLIIVATDVERGLTYLGYAYLLMALMFWLFTRNDRQMLAE